MLHTEKSLGKKADSFYQDQLAIFSPTMDIIIETMKILGKTHHSDV